MKKFWCALLLVMVAAESSWAAPVIATQPKAQSVVFGQRAVFSVAASGEGLSYQWRKDGAAIVGATTNQLVIEAPDFFHQGRYSVLVRNAGEITTSAEAELRVRSPQPGDVDVAVLSDSWINGNVAALAVQGNGKVVIGGDFQAVSGAIRTRLARLEADGKTDYRFLNGMAGVGDRSWDSVSAVALQDGGKILVAGTFLTVNGTNKSGLVRLNEDGSIDATFQNPGIEGYAVYALRVQNDGKIMIGGLFARVNGVVRQSLARLNANGSLDETFQSPLPDSASIDALDVQGDGKVLIPFGRTVVRLNKDGNVDGSFVAPEINLVRGINVDESGNILVRGFRTGTGGGQGLVRLTSVGTEDTDFNPIQDGEVRSVALSGGKILIGGTFSKVNGEDHRGLARLNLDGSTDSAFAAQLGGEWIAVNAMELHDSKVIIAGTFKRVNGRDRINVARLNLDGTMDESFNNLEKRPVVAHQIQAMAEQNDGKIVVAGLENEGGSIYNRFTRLNPELTSDESFVPRSLYDTRALAIQSAGKIIAGGYGWTMFRVNTDGTDDMTFTKPDLNIPRWDLATRSPFRWPEVFAIIVQPDDKFIAGGYFNAGASNNLARFDVDGVLDDSFKAGANLEVRSLALQRDGRILLGGMFTTVNAVSRNGIARVGPTGSLDEGFLNGLAGVQGGTVETVELQSDGKILIGGDFTNVNAVTRSGIARLNEDGSLDGSFQSPGRAAVSRIAVDGQGRILVAGTINSEPNVLIRLKTDGSVDESFRKLVTAPTGINAMEVLRDGSVLIGGSFTSVNGQVMLYLARAWGDAPLLTAIRRNGADVQMSWSTQANETYQVQIKESLHEEWVSASDTAKGTGEIMMFLDNGAGGQKFYRVIQEQ